MLRIIFSSLIHARYNLESIILNQCPYRTPYSKLLKIHFSYLLNKHKRYRACFNNENLIININIVLKNILALNKRSYIEKKCPFYVLYIQ